jgi:hypothetical protein
MRSPHVDPSTLLAFAEGDLAAAAASAVAAHLASGCAPCRERLRRVARLSIAPAAAALPFLAAGAAAELAALGRAVAQLEGRGGGSTGGPAQSPTQSPTGAPADDPATRAGSARALRRLWGRALALVSGSAAGAADDGQLADLAAALARIAAADGRAAEAAAWSQRAARLERLARGGSPPAGRRAAARPRRAGGGGGGAGET